MKIKCLVLVVFIAICFPGLPQGNGSGKWTWPDGFEGVRVYSSLDKSGQIPYIQSINMYNMAVKKLTPRQTEALISDNDIEAIQNSEPTKSSPEFEGLAINGKDIIFGRTNSMIDLILFNGGNEMPLEDAFNLLPINK